VLGLRPFTAKAEILPEQVIGRGLRLMVGIGPDRTQTLEVLGTRNLLDVLRTQLEAEGVGVATAKSDPPRPVIIEPVIDRLAYDIAIPITKPRLSHNVRKLSDLDPLSFKPIYDQKELDEVLRISLRMEFATTETEVHQDDLVAGWEPFAEEILGSITKKVMQFARLANVFSELYPIVRTYVVNRCFGQVVNVDDEKIRAHLNRLDLREGIAKYLARKISELTVEKATLQFENADFKLSDTRPFGWKRNLPPLVAKRTVFNHVATYNSFERQFAEFLDSAKDVLRFASLGTTEQGESGTEFRVDYLKPSGAIGFYHPDWVAVQKSAAGEINWILETKGRQWEDTEAKETAMHEWCKRVSEETGQTWKHARINQVDFNSRRPKTLAQAVAPDNTGDLLD
jgi:type III restriction enzyme